MEGFTLRSLADERDARMFARFNAAYNNPGEGASCEILLHDFPGLHRDCCWLVEDGAGEIAATSCLIPWEINFEGAPLRAAMLEMVLCRPDCRRKGLIRQLIARFHEAVDEGRYDVSVITGIPYFYRQFGYAYCFDLGGSVSLSKVPVAPCGALSLRGASAGDIPVLEKLYKQAMKDVPVRFERGAELWRYMLEAAGYRIWILEDRRKGEPRGYAIAGGVEGGRLDIVESYVTAAEAQASLGLLAGLAPDGLSVCLQPGPLAEEALKAGGERAEGGQWLVRIPSPGALLRKLSGVFSRRLAESPLKGFTGGFVLNFYRQAYILRFENGALAAVDDAGFVDSSMGADGGDLCIPPEAFVRLLFGYRSIERLRDAWPDTVVRQGNRQLAEILFPEKKSWLFAPWQYQSEPRR